MLEFVGHGFSFSAFVDDALNTDLLSSDTTGSPPK